MWGVGLEAWGWPVSVVVQEYLFATRPVLRANEADRVALRVRAQHPGDILHVPEGWVLAVQVVGARGHGERDSGVEPAALHDAVGRTDSGGNGGVTARQAERWFAVGGGAALDLDFLTDSSTSRHRHLPCG